jgi:prevent-host-death family protein
MTATDAKATILRLHGEVALGEEIEITKRGRPVTRLMPARGARMLERSFDGRARTAVEGDELLSPDVPWNAA